MRATLAIGEIVPAAAKSRYVGADPQTAPTVKTRYVTTFLRGGPPPDALNSALAPQPDPLLRVPKAIPNTRAPERTTPVVAVIAAAQHKWDRSESYSTQCSAQEYRYPSSSWSHSHNRSSSSCKCTQRGRIRTGCWCMTSSSGRCRRSRELALGTTDRRRCSPSR
jgi:hypothetical protein